MASFYVPQHRKRLLFAGVGLIVVAVIFWVVLALVVIYLRFRSGGGSGSGGFSGAGFGGGFSGGGGASGSW